jgi:glucose/arabinose dehydrogenase
MPYHLRGMKRLGFAALIVLALVTLLATRPSEGASSGAPAVLQAPAQVVLTPLATGLTSITSITNAGDGRLFLTVQSGRILVWDGLQIRPTPFLDVSSLIICCGEQGLLSVAFHPNYAQNGYFFVDYTNVTGQTVVARYRVSSNPNVADSFSGVILLTIDQPYTNHNGGQLQFGPDGFLYIGMGDGGSANDPLCNAQSSQSLLGKLLRIDVDRSVATPPYYGIPPSNPFLANGDAPPEAWAKGVRNPWRFSFDRLTGDLLIGDVGQGSWEEVDFQPAGSPGGQNYGWKLMEGTHCGGGGSAGCMPGVPPCGDPAYTLPILEYDHGGGRCSITGGYVYRGLSIPDLYGTYVYGDFCSGEIWAASPQSGAWTSTLLPIQISQLQTFGQDAIGELYVGTGNGTFAIVQPAVPSTPVIGALSPASGLTRGGETVTISGANFTGQTQVFFGGTFTPSTVLSPTTLVTHSVPHAPGPVDVLVANPGAPPAVKLAGYVYLPIPLAAAPAVTPRVVTRPPS